MQATHASGEPGAEQRGTGLPELRAGALSLPGAIMQGVAFIGPAIAALFFVPFVVSLAGENAPLAYPIGFAITLALGWVLVQFARKLPSAGGYFTYNSRALHPWAGWLSMWAFSFYMPLIGGPLSGYFGFILQGVLRDRYGDTWFHWWFAPLLILPLIAWIGYRGVRVTQAVLVTLGALEFLIVLALGINGLIEPGPGGFSLAPFDPSHIGTKGVTASGFALAAIFAVQAYMGWDAAAPLAEETTDAKRNTPRAVLWTIFILGAFLVIVNWGVVVGWGTDKISTLPASQVLPGLVLAERFWGAGWWLLIFAFFSSVTAASLACTNASSRMWYKAGHVGALPTFFARIHREHQTPHLAILFQLVVNLISGLVLGIAFGPDVMFFFCTGLLLVLAVIVVYTIANIGVFFFYRREYPREFNVFSHVLVPVFATASSLYLLYKSFDPMPASPYKYSPEIIGGWMLLGIAILIYARRTGRDAWAMGAGQALAEDLEPLDLRRPVQPVSAAVVGESPEGA